MEQFINKSYNQIVEFVKKYSEAFTEEEKKYLLNYSKRGHVENKMVPDLVREVYDRMGLLNEDENAYLGFLDLLEKEFPFKERNIIEVGGGIFPSLARRISKMQTTGKITVYDPRLERHEETTPKLTLVREKFYPETEIKGADLLIGFMPCEATYNIIDAASRNNIDFMIALCEGGPHGDIFDFFESEEDWLNTIIYMAERGIEDNNMGVLEKTYLKKYHNPYPVIYNKRV